MKIVENAKVLNEEEMNAVSGGFEIGFEKTKRLVIITSL